MAKTLKVAVLGSGSVKEGAPSYDMAVELGRLLVEKGCMVVTGGYFGIMEAAARGARNAKGMALGVTLPMKPEGNTYCNAKIQVGGKTLEEQFLLRLGKLLACDVLVFFDGESGTIVEVCTALHIARIAGKLGIDVSTSPKKLMIFIGQELGAKLKTLHELGFDTDVTLVSSAEEAMALIDA